MKIWYSEYGLRPNAPSPDSPSRPRRGALLKIEDDECGICFADCHPWVERGDAPLHDQLKQLAAQKLTPLTERSLFFSRLDAAARRAHRHLFDGLAIPRSHGLVFHVNPHTAEVIESLQHSGVTTIKMKIGCSIETESALIETLIQRFSHIRLRLDCNAVLSPQQVDGFLAGRSERFFEALDFIEDPTMFDAGAWRALEKKFGIRCARDEGSDSASVADVSVAVIKPAVQNPFPVVTAAMKLKREIVITTYLDHPLGQLAAAYSAAIAKRNAPEVVRVCGLLSHTVYEPNAFSQKLAIRDAILIPPGGTGFGFDDELKDLAWTKLR